MRVYNEIPKDISKGVARVRDAIKRHAPEGVTFVGDRDEANLVVHHVIGVQNLDTLTIGERILEDQRAGRTSAMIQYCLKTTENGGDPGYWAPLWGLSTCVWSYYDLEPLARGGFQGLPLGTWDDTFYHAPLGVDDVFRVPLTDVPKLFTIGTSGYVAETEGVVECARAVDGTGGFQFHLGPDFGLTQRCASQHNLLDADVARRWAECRYVAGLRRVEGFELPAAEGLCMGARPILFDAPHYRQWFGDAGRYIPENDPEDVVRNLKRLFMTEDPVTPAEREWAREQFNWARLVPEFWRRVL